MKEPSTTRPSTSVTRHCRFTYPLRAFNSGCFCVCVCVCVCVCARARACACVRVQPRARHGRSSTRSCSFEMRRAASYRVQKRRGCSMSCVSVQVRRVRAVAAACGTPGGSAPAVLRRCTHLLVHGLFAPARVHHLCCVPRILVRVVCRISARSACAGAARAQAPRAQAQAAVPHQAPSPSSTVCHADSALPILPHCPCSPRAAGGDGAHRHLPKSVACISSMSAALFFVLPLTRSPAQPSLGSPASIKFVPCLDERREANQILLW